MHNDSFSPHLDFTLRGHKKSVNFVEFSKNGSKMVSCSDDHQVILWDFCNGSELKRSYRLTSHFDIVHCVDFSPNNNFFVSCSRDRSAQLWKMSLGKPESSPIIYKCHCNTIRCINISPCSDYFCTASDDKSIRIWSTSSKNKQIQLLKGHTNWIRCCKYCPDDGNMISSCGDDSNILIHDIRGPFSHRVQKLDSKRSIKFTFLDWYPNNKNLLAASSHDGSIRIFDLRANRVLQYYSSHSHSINTINFHPSGNYLLSSSDDASSKIFDLLEGRVLFTLRVHTGPVMCATFTSDGNKFATVGSDCLINLWNSNLPSEFDNNNNKNENNSGIKPLEETLLMPDKCESLVNEISLEHVQDTKECSTKDAILNALLNQINVLADSVTIIEQRLTNLENQFIKMKM